jgi:miniconductance mechanosensitive channel
MVLTAALALGGMLDTVNAYHQSRPRTRLRSVKGYVQVVKIAVYAVATILVVAALIDRSPAILLSGLGAMAAVLLLIFQDTLLSLVASVQITTGDLVRIGDWIEMPQLNADGDVVDIALHTVKVQNFDRTITTIPTKKLISDSFRNWRGMKETGARRIKRSLLIDQTSIRFLDADERARLRDFRLIDDYLDAKAQEMDAWNADLRRQGIKPVNARRVTNIGTFRVYVERYLRSHPGVHQAMSLMVRQLEPTAQGLPIEVYCFSNTTVWTEYEGIQSDIFDHLLATVPDFGLRVFQAPTGADVQSLRPAPPAVPGGAARDSGAAGAFGIEPARQGPPARRGG